LSLVLDSGLQAAEQNLSSSFKPESFQAFIDQKTPSMIVFSASYCAHCPAVVRSLAKQSRRMAKPPRLIVVSEMAIRHAVNPTWRGLTPFVVLVGKDGRASYFNGQPPGPDLQAWLSQQAP
jgi:thiol-disulfide isomerase/thioredoxin